MNVWKLVSVGNLEHCETENPAREEGKVRVRVTKVLVNGTDSAIFNGTLKVRCPLIPGRYAVGMVAEDGVPHLPKGTRLLLHSVIDAPDTGTTPKDFTEDEFLLCGRTTDGYMRDLISIPPEQFTVLPDSLHEAYAVASKQFRGLGVEELEGSTPSLCRMALTEASLNEVKRTKGVTTCPYCHRILIVDEGDQK